MKKLPYVKKFWDLQHAERSSFSRYEHNKLTAQEVNEYNEWAALGCEIATEERNLRIHRSLGHLYQIDCYFYIFEKYNKDDVFRLIQKGLCHSRTHCRFTTAPKRPGGFSAYDCGHARNFFPYFFEDKDVEYFSPEKFEFQYYLFISGEKDGPFSYMELKGRVLDLTIDRYTLVKKNGFFSRKVPLGEMHPELFEVDWLKGKVILLPQFDRVPSSHRIIGTETEVEKRSSDARM